MSKLADAFGDKYQAKRNEILTRSFVLGGHTFRVKIPLVAESDAIYKRIQSPPQDRIDALFAKLSATVKDSDTVQRTENDVLIDNVSLREMATNKVSTEMKITEFIKLLIPEIGDSLDHITYADIEEEFPLAIQLSLVEKISDVISPGYKESRGN